MDTINTSKLVKLALAGIAFLLLLWGLFYLFTHGTLSIQSDTVAAISVVDSKNKSIAEVKGSYHHILPTGEYTISVKNGQGIVRKLVSVSIFKTTEVTLKPQTPLIPHAVTNYSVSNVYDNGTNLEFVNNDLHNFGTIDSNNTLTSTDVGYQVDDAVYINNKVIVRVQNSDYSYSLYQKDSSTLTPITLPDNVSSAKNISISSFKNKLYVVSDTVLYSVSPSDFSFKKITDVDTGSQILDASDTSIALGTYTEKDISVSLYSASDGKKTANQSFVNSETQQFNFSLKLSPNGSSIIVVNDGKGNIYSNTLEQKVAFPDTDISAGLWLSDSTVMYVSNNNLWTYNKGTETSFNTATMPLYSNIYGLYASSDQKKFYISTQSSNYSSLYVVDTSAQQANTSIVDKVSESNMQQLDFCTIHYVNYTKLIFVAVSPFFDETTCRNNIVTYLDSIGIREPVTILFEGTPGDKEVI